MTPLPHNSTNILYLDYTSCLHDHILACRYSLPNSAADAMGAIDDLLTALAPSWLFLLTVRGARYQIQGTDVSIPITWTGEATYGSGAGTEPDSAKYLGFPGRDTDGHRNRVEVFGVKFEITAGKYRVQASADDGAAAAIDVLKGSEGTFLSIGGKPPLWKSYGNLGVNAYWRNKIR